MALKIFIWGILAVVFSGVNLRAEGVAIDTRVDQTEITIGDRVNLEVVIYADTTLEVVLPATEELLGVFEVKDYQVFDPLIDETGRRIYRSWYNLTTWTTGRWVVPPLTVSFTDSTGQSGSASSDSIFINVRSILSAAGEDTIDVRDLKPLYEVPTARAVYYYIAGGILLAALIVWWVFHRRWRKEEAAGEDTRTPDERAFDELNELRDSDCLPQERWREWYLALTEIFRRYLDGRYGVESLEATTAEVKLILPGLPLGEKESGEVVELLEFADLVKFARLVPPPERPQADFAWVWAFVERTKIQALLSTEETPVTQRTGTEG